MDNINNQSVKTRVNQKKVDCVVDSTIRNQPLTNAEKEVLHLITEEFCTIKQLIQRRKCSKQAIYKIIKKLKEKGAYNLGLQKVDSINPPLDPPHQIRLHGQEFNIKIIWQDEKYHQILNKSNVIYLDGNTIRLYGNSIEVYSGQSFYGDEANSVTAKSMEYWQRFFIRLEHELKAILIKPRAMNVRLVNQHYARTNSEIAEAALEMKKPIKVYAKEDGKLCFITDDSFGFKEDETVHPKTAQPDRICIDKQVNDWRINNPPTNSELSIHIAQVTENQLMFAKNIKSHIKAIQSLASGVEELTKLVKELKNDN